MAAIAKMTAMKRSAVVLAVAALLGCRREAPAPAKTETTATKVTIDKPLDLTKKEIDQKIPSVPPFVDANAIGPKLGPDGTVNGEQKVFKHTDPIYLTMKFHDSPKGLVANISVDDMHNHTVHHEERPMNGSKVITFLVPAKTLKPGQYHVEGYWGGNLAVDYVIAVN